MLHHAISRYIARYITLYVATLHCTLCRNTTSPSTSHSYSYVTTLCHVPTSQPYVTALRHTSMSHLHRIATASLHRIATACVAPRDKSGDRTISGPKGQLLHRMHVTMQQVQTVPRFLQHSLRCFFDPSRSRPS